MYTKQCFVYNNNASLIFLFIVRKTYEEYFIAF